MPICPNRSSGTPRGGAAPFSTHGHGIAPEDIDETWLDDMTKRLFAELKRQLAQVEGSKPTDCASERAANARTLASLERTLERLARLEQQRVLTRETKVAAHHDQALAALERRLDRLVAAGAASGGSEGADGA